MSAALALDFDILGEPPTAYVVAEAGRKARVGSTTKRSAWDLPQQKPLSAMKATKLPGMSALLEHWEPLHARSIRPGTELREKIVARWPVGTIEREVLDRLLAEARSLDQGQLVRFEIKNLASEAKSATNANQRDFYATLDAALKDLKSIKPERARAFMVHPDTIERAQWTMHELLVFIETHWALGRTHAELKALAQRRLAVVRQFAGSLKGSGGMADAHDELE